LAEALLGSLLAGIASFALWCRSRWPGRGPAMTVAARSWRWGPGR